MLIYSALALLVVLCAFGLLPHVLPGALARRVAYNSEGYLFALVLVMWIREAPPRLATHRRVGVGVLVGVAFLVIGVALVLSDLRSSIRTLNEACLALGVLIPYVSLPRPVSRRFLLVVPALVLLVVYAVAWSPDSWVIDQAETIGFVILTVVTLDIVDREWLDPGRITSSTRRWGWCAVLLAEPVVVSALGTQAREGDGWLPSSLEFLGRVHESFFGVLLVVLLLTLMRWATTGDRVRTGSRPAVMAD